MIDKLTPEFLSDLRNTHSNMSSVEAKTEDIVSFTVKKSKLKLKPSNITYSSIYGDPKSEEYNIAYSFLDSLSSLPREVLQAVAGNVVLAGGLWKVKGMQNYFKKQVKEHLESFP